MNKRLWGSTGMVLASMLAVSACGGGGGGGGIVSAPLVPATPTPTPVPVPPPPVTPVSYTTPEDLRSNAATSSNAVSAYQAGATGAGVKIGVIDSGINTTLAEFAGKIDPASKDVAGSRGLGDDDGHGTAVASVAAAARNGVGTHGVAFDSSLVVMRADTVDSCAIPVVNDVGGCSFNDSAISAGVDAARLAGAKVINLSLGGSPPNSNLLAAMGRAANAGIVLVISAGNDGDKPEGVNADPFALIPAQNFAGSVIIAGSVGVTDGAGGTDLSQLSTFSNKAGTGASYYLAALGYRVQAISTDGKQYLWSGTSFSAPTISGAVALMAQAFPNLTGKQIVSLLFSSADDLGVTGTDATFGRGRLNLAKAFAPAGTTSLAGSQILVSTSSNGSLPAAAGDAGTKVTAGAFGAVILDGFSRAYAIDLAQTLGRAAAAQPLRNAIGGRSHVAGVGNDRFNVAMTVTQRDGSARDFELARLGIGPNDAQRARLVAGSAVARIDRRTAAAFGFAEGAKAMERRLSGASAGAFLIAHDVASDTGFAARRGASMAVRHQFGGVAVTASAETGKVWQDIATRDQQSTYRLTSIGIDKALGSTFLSAGMSRLDERDTLLGGRLGPAFGASGSSTLFFDAEARHSLGGGWNSSVAARRGWTSFGAGRFQSDAYAVDLTRAGLFGNDRIGLRVSQPLRIASGGFAAMLPTAYDYSTLTTTSTLQRFSLAPSGREVDGELSYGRGVLGSGWVGGNVYLRRQPGHVASAPNDVGAAFRFSLGF
ncbi:MAG: S8 family peptidase [Sphingomicrobium sp.]